MRNIISQAQLINETDKRLINVAERQTGESFSMKTYYTRAV